MRFCSAQITYEDTHTNKCASILHIKNSLVYFNKESEKEVLLSELNNMIVNNIYFDATTLYSTENIFNRESAKMKHGLQLFTPAEPSLFRSKDASKKLNFTFLNNSALQDIYILKFNASIETKPAVAHRKLLANNDNFIYIPIYKTILLEKVDNKILAAYFIGTNLTENPNNEGAFSNIKLSFLG